jgi:hypothetical protein
MDKAALELGMAPVPFQRVDRTAAVSHFLRFIPRKSPELEANAEAQIDDIVRRLQPEAQAGEELWVYKSRHIGALAGHEGLAVVRDGTVLRHETIVQY